MLFNSITFLIFFPTVLVLYFIIPHKLRNLFLLLASCVFYMWLIPWYILVLLFLIVVDYFSAIYIEKHSGRTRKRILIVSILSMSLVLFVFKYDVLLNEITKSIFSFFSIKFSTPTFNWALPIGLSFHTFQSLSYVIEVYRGHQKAERNFIIYALYVMFFPQLVAGPIERPQHMIPQFRRVHHFLYTNIVEGCRLILWGLFKKVVVADRIALLVNHTFSNIGRFDGLPLLLALCFFAIQIYLDFSAYSDIARGTAKCMGFDLSINFNRPYFATSISEFWRRWHISLTNWFKDYVYVPLGGNRVSSVRNKVNLMITFTLSGIWHGAHIQFALWGIINGLYLVIEKMTSIRVKIKVPDYIKRLGVFISAVFAFTFFRSKSVEEAFLIFTKVFQGLYIDIVHAVDLLFKGKDVTLDMYGNEEFKLGYIFVYILVIWIVEYFFEKPDTRLNKIVHKAFTEKGWIRWSMYYALLFSIIFFGTFKHIEFIYFQF